MMAAAVTENETDQPPAAAAASDDDNARPAPPAAKPKLLDPQLLMAACQGDSERLKELLQLKKDDEEHAHGMVEEAAAAAEVVIVEVVPRHPPAPPTPAPTRSGSASAPLPPALDDDGVTMEGDTLLHMVAASGDGPGFLRCARMIVRHKERKGLVVVQVLEARNHNGDTPLHCAAGAGNVNMISCLVDLIDEAPAVAVKKAAFLKIQNKCGETALHQAIRAPKNKAECIDQLMDVDPELACIPLPHHQEEDDAGASPLYLAISLGEIEIAQHLYVKSKGKLSYSGSDGRNVLHAAVSCNREAVLPMVLGWLKGLRMADDDGDMRARRHHVNVTGGIDLLSQLTNERDKENGSTPLHLAASLGGLPSATFLPPWQVRPPAAAAATRLLLDANESTAYQPDKRGLYPIHVAAGGGSLGPVEALLGRCPGCATLRDAKGRTFLHVAAEEGCYSVVKYVCDQSQPQRRLCWRRKSPADAAVAVLLSSILNVQDMNGDTPLHRAVHAADLRVVQRLMGNRQVCLDVPNKEGMRPIDVSWSMIPLRYYYAWDPRIHIRISLLEVGAPFGESRGDLFDEKRKGMLPKGDKEDKMSDNLTDAAQVLGLFSVLITTVTFASAFTLPGGYRSAGDGGDGGAAGTPVLAGRSYVFDAFVLSDALAFICSLGATSLLLYAGVPNNLNLDGRFHLINFAYTLMWHAGRSLLAAFGLGLYIALLPVDRTIAISVVVLMVIVAAGFCKGSEGIISMAVIRRSRKRSIWDTVLQGTIFGLDLFWSCIIIFGLPAIRKWARLP